MTEGPQQIAVVGREGGEILEEGQHTDISADQTEALYVEIKCENCGEVGTYSGRLVTEADHRFQSNHSEACHHCGNPLEATVQLREDTTSGGLNVEGFEPPEGGSYNHDPYFANKVEGVGGGTPTGPPP